MLNKLRTLTLITVPSMIFEKLILSKMRTKVDSLLGRHRHTYRRGLSTATSLLVLHDSLTRVYDDPQYQGVALLSLDFTKASSESATRLCDMAEKLPVKSSSQSKNPRSAIGRAYSRRGSPARIGTRALSVLHSGRRSSFRDTWKYMYPICR